MNTDCGEKNVEFFIGVILVLFIGMMILIPVGVIYMNYKYEWVCIDQGVVSEIVSVGHGKPPYVRYRLSDNREVNLRRGFVKGDSVCVTEKRVKKH